MKPTPLRSGYVEVTIHGKKFQLHRLIAIAFDLPRQPGQTTVDHIDNDPSNNAVWNLRWASPSEQVRHSYASNANRKSSAPKLSKPVRGRRVGTSDWNEYASCSAAARELGVHPGSVSLCCLRKRNHTGGFEFEFAAQAEPELLEGEEWRNVQGSDAEVSSLGRFRSTFGVITKPTPKRTGYVRVRIEGKILGLHRLIAIAFDLPRQPGQTTVDHIDNDPSNNAVWNLRWASPSEQTRHSYASNANRKSCAPKKSKPVRGRRVGASEWTQYASTKAAARELGVKQGNVSLCCQRKRNHTGGFEFEFAAQAEPELLDGEEWRDVVCVE